MDEFSVHPNETSSADEAQLDTSVRERLSIKAPDLRPVNIVPGQMDQAGRKIKDVYWISKHYAIYRWRKCTDEKSFLRMAKRNSFTYGIAVQLCDDKEHNASYAQIGPDLAQIAALQKGSLSTRCSVNCETAARGAVAVAA